MTAEEGAAWGFYNALEPAESLLDRADAMARDLMRGPRFAHMMTKTMLNQEWSMSVDMAIEAEAQAQAICMRTEDFRIAFDAFAAKGKPVFTGR
jgi:enoyl-CoA hydratase/carnithine racemase